MGLGHLLFGFLQRIAIGAGAIFVLLLVVRLSTRSRSEIVVRRTTK
jgi:hypothetical protein